jgi:translation initiation factor eIF-2B subunit epsilon
MFPVANVPLLHYIIEFLVTNQVKEIIIATRKNIDIIRDFINKQGYKAYKVKFQVVTISADSKSFGDALRQVADNHIIKDDFVLVRGDIITNMNIQGALKMHYHVKQQEAKKENQTSETRKLKTIMTKIFKSMAYSNPLRDPANTDVTLMFDSQTRELMKYQSALGPDQRRQQKTFQINEEHFTIHKSYQPPRKDMEVFEDDNLTALKCNNVYTKGTSLEIRQDLVDCDIAICTEDVLNLFSDNFDKTNLKDGFINWLYESEVMEDRIRVFQVRDQGAYFARIANPRLYGVVTRDVISRRAYPMVIDKRSMDKEHNYNFSMPNTYIDNSVQISVQSTVGENSVIGKDTSIDQNSRVVGSVIGRGCCIGKNVTILDSIIESGVTVEDGCSISSAII